MAIPFYQKTQFYLFQLFMKNNPLLRLLLVVLVSQVIVSCKSARDFHSASHRAVYSSSQYEALLAQRTATEQAATSPENTVSPQLATPSRPAVESAGELQSNASNDEAYAKEMGKPVSAREKMKTQPLQSRTLSPDMKAALQKAKAVLETNQAAGKKLTKEAKKQEKAALKSVLKEAKANADDTKVLQIILAILIPPLAVYLHEDQINSKFWIDLVLTILFFIPGVVYALLVVTDSIK